VLSYQYIIKIILITFLGFFIFSLVVNIALSVTFQLLAGRPTLLSFSINFNKRSRECDWTGYWSMWLVAFNGMAVLYNRFLVLAILHQYQMFCHVRKSIINALYTSKIYSVIKRFFVYDLCFYIFTYSLSILDCDIFMLLRGWHVTCSILLSLAWLLHCTVEPHTGLALL
jgi:hypothetical protein